MVWEGDVKETSVEVKVAVLARLANSSGVAWVTDNSVFSHGMHAMHLQCVCAE